MIEFNNVKYTENMTSLSFEIVGKGIHGIFCDEEAEMKVLTDILSGARHCFAGAVLLGKEQAEAPVSECRSKIGCVLSDMPLYNDMTVEETLDFIGRAKRIEPDKRYRQIKEALSLVDIERIANKQIGRLSAQNKARVAIAQALLGNPDVLIFEEPTKNVDETCAKEMRELIDMLGKMKTVIILSLNGAFLCELCEDVFAILKGSMTYCGKTDMFGVYLDIKSKESEDK